MKHFAKIKHDYNNCHRNIIECNNYYKDLITKMAIIIANIVKLSNMCKELWEQIILQIDI